jgi:hypothetical protein
LVQGHVKLASDGQLTLGHGGAAFRTAHGREFLALVRAEATTAEPAAFVALSRARARARTSARPVSWSFAVAVPRAHAHFLPYAEPESYAARSAAAGESFAAASGAASRQVSELQFEDDQDGARDLSRRNA